jgi:hypothetical protein
MGIFSIGAYVLLPFLGGFFIGACTGFYLAAMWQEKPLTPKVNTNCDLCDCKLCDLRYNQDTW